MIVSIILAVIAAFQFLLWHRQGEIIKCLSKQKRVEGAISADPSNGKEKFEGVIYAD